MATVGATTTELSLNGAEAEKVLGVCWKDQSDILTFKVDHITEVVCIRVGIASNVTSLFYPQGMATPMVVKFQNQATRARRSGTTVDGPGGWLKL